jgi:lipopolysaccharide/colanic/teichoic acid biosynthesis glycosyltransferase
LGTTVSESDQRVTRVGGFLRRWALDELPQLWNVLKGEMSLIGPRPTFAYQVEQYDEVQRRRLEVRPGITGWAQINGRNAIEWPKRIELDVWYVDNATLWLDLKIMLKTLWLAFVVRSGVYGDEGVNPDFR